eukprot:2132219-Alexandrium_andersonii.AAC.1
MSLRAAADATFYSTGTTRPPSHHAYGNMSYVHKARFSAHIPLCMPQAPLHCRCSMPAQALPSPSVALYPFTPCTATL